MKDAGLLVWQNGRSKTRWCSAVPDHHHKHEPILYGTFVPAESGGWAAAEPAGLGTTLQTTVLMRFDKPPSNAEHPNDEAGRLIEAMLSTASWQGRFRSVPPVPVPR